MVMRQRDVPIDLDAAETLDLRRTGPVQVQYTGVLRIDRSGVVVEEGGHFVRGW